MTLIKEFLNVLTVLKTDITNRFCKINPTHKNFKMCRTVTFPQSIAADPNTGSPVKHTAYMDGYAAT